MKFVVKECLNAGCRASSAGAASLDGILFNKLLFDFSRKRFGEDSRRTGLPEAVPRRQIRCDIGDLSREIAAFAPNRVGK
jgi:hypothetical protein